LQEEKHGSDFFSPKSKPLHTGLCFLALHSKTRLRLGVASSWKKAQRENSFGI